MEVFYRLKSSKKRARWPCELLEQIKKNFEKKFENPAQKGEFLVKGFICPKEFLFKIGYLEDNQISQKNFHISKDFSSKTDKPEDVIELIVDYSMSLMEHYFNNSSQNLPRKWSTQTFQDETIFFLFSTENDSLEEQADKLLNLSKEESFFQTQDDEEDILTQIQIDHLFLNRKKERKV